MTVRVLGLAQVQRDLRMLAGGMDKGLQAELKEIGDMVASDARSRFSRYDEKSAAGIIPRVRVGVVVVEQKLRKTTALRPDWGRLQMRKALEPALEDKQDDILRMTHVMVDRVIHEHHL